ncbi:MFS monosaccharide transporter [Atractiella rhizophila]|nr:MFS monosaccharide transporter [Atractiella rhizophila]
MSTSYIYGVGAFAAIGSLLFGFDTGIATTTIAHDSWKEYMGHPSKAATGAVVAVYIGGEAIGAILQTLIGDYLGRIRFMQLMCIIVTVGVTIQTASQGFGMFLAGRAIAGAAVGGLISTVPIYNSEISPPNIRGVVAGFSGVMIALGTSLSNWVGFACSYAPDGPVQWRLPLALQIPWGVILFFGLQFYLPDSARWLIRNGRDEEALRAFKRVRQELTVAEVEHEFTVMRQQILYEKETEVTSYREIFTRYRTRAMVSIAVQTMTSLTGVNVIQYYQTTLYKSLGINGHMILALAAIYGTVGLIANYFTTFYLADRWGRRPLLLFGLAAVILDEIYSAVMTRYFQHSDNRVGKGFAILGIYLFVVIYYGMINSTTWLYGAEVLPVSIRSKVMGLASFSHFAVNVGITEAGPSAFANIGYKYYFVFVGCTTFFFIFGLFYYKETKGKTLEEIAKVFSDKTYDDEKPEKLEDEEKREDEWRSVTSVNSEKDRAV